MTRTTLLRASLLAIPLAFVMFAFASKSDAETDAAMPRVRVLLTSGTGDLGTANLMVARAELIGDAGQTVDLLDGVHAVSMRDLNDGITPEIADAEVPPGTYVHLRLTLADPQGEDPAEAMPDAAPRELSLPRLDLRAGGEIAVVTLNFDANDHATDDAEVLDIPSALRPDFRVLSAEIYK